MIVKYIFFSLKNGSSLLAKTERKHDWVGSDIGKFEGDQTVELLLFLSGLDLVGTFISSCLREKKQGHLRLR